MNRPFSGTCIQLVAANRWPCGHASQSVPGSTSRFTVQLIVPVVVLLPSIVLVGAVVSGPAEC